MKLQLQLTLLMFSAFSCTAQTNDPLYLPQRSENPNRKTARTITHADNQKTMVLEKIEKTEWQRSNQPVWDAIEAEKAKAFAQYRDAEMTKIAELHRLDKQRAALHSPKAVSVTADKPMKKGKRGR